MEGAAKGVSAQRSAQRPCMPTLQRAWAAPWDLSQQQDRVHQRSVLPMFLHPSRPWFPTAAQGPTETPFEGGSFELSINVPEQYPLVPPTVRFKTKIFHPNVHFRVSCLVH